MPKVVEVSTKILSAMWGVTTKTIADWSLEESGWLFPAKIRRGVFDSRKAHQLYLENKILPQYERPDSDSESMDDAKRRKEIAAANIKELEEAELRGRLIDKDEAIQWVGALVDEARTAFVAMPRRMAPVIYGKEIRDSENMIRKEVTRILNKLARPLDDEKAGS